MQELLHVTRTLPLVEAAFDHCCIMQSSLQKEDNAAQCIKELQERQHELQDALGDEKSKVSRAELTIAQMSSERDFEMAHKAQLEVAL